MLCFAEFTSMGSPYCETKPIIRSQCWNKRFEGRVRGLMFRGEINFERCHFMIDFRWKVAISAIRSPAVYPCSQNLVMTFHSRFICFICIQVSRIWFVNVPWSTVAECGAGDNSPRPNIWPPRVHPQTRSLQAPATGGSIQFNQVLQQLIANGEAQDQ